MILFIFRLTGFLSLLGLVGYLFLGPKVPKTLTAELEKSNEEYKSLRVQLESDKNESESELSVVFRSRVDFRNKEEEAIGKIQDLKSEINGLAPKLDEFEGEIKTKSDELEKLTEEFSESRKPIDTIVQQKKPLEEKLKIIEEDFKKIDFKSLNNIDIYLYDGSHHYVDHFDSIKLVLPSLSKKFILIVDDWNWVQVRKGTLDAIKSKNLEIISKLEIKTTTDDSSSLITGKNSDWHQGVAFFVIEK